MAKSYSNKYQYETSPRKLEPYYNPKTTKQPKKNQNNKNETTKVKNNKKREVEKLKRKVVFYSLAVLAMFFVITYRNAMIDENFEKVQNLKSELASIEKENMQLEVAIESNLNLTNLEQQARSMLGMQKISSTQTEYVNLPKTDYIEAASEQVKIEEEKGFFETIADNFLKLFK